MFCLVQQFSAAYCSLEKRESISYLKLSHKSLLLFSQNCQTIKDKVVKLHVVYIGKF